MRTDRLRLTFNVLRFAALSVLLSGTVRAQPDTRAVRTKDGVTLKVETFVAGLEVPWSLAFTSSTRVLVTERPGRVRVVENGVLRETPLAVIADVESRGETGLMGLARSPDYPASRLIYLSYAYTVAGGIQVRVVRFHDDGSRLSGRKVILEGLPAAQFHAGCRLRFGPDGKLYVTTGDATIPPDNPFPGSPIFSLGHRNSQGLDWQPGTGLQFQTEHGPSGFDGPGGGDEVNIVEAGKNYGWPVVHHKLSRAGMVSPLLEFTPAIAPSGASFVTGSKLLALRNDFLFACLRGERLVRVRLDPRGPRHVLATEALFDHEYGRLREVQNGPDGAIYFTTSNRDGRGNTRSGDDRILRLTQAAP